MKIPTADEIKQHNQQAKRLKWILYSLGIATVGFSYLFAFWLNKHFLYSTNSPFLINIHARMIFGLVIIILMFLAIAIAGIMGAIQRRWH